MNEEKSFLLQKQVRDNSEDLQKELLDLKNWEQEMKRKEEELLNSHEQVILTRVYLCFFLRISYFTKVFKKAINDLRKVKGIKFSK